MPSLVAEMQLSQHQIIFISNFFLKVQSKAYRLKNNSPQIVDIN